MAENKDIVMAEKKDVLGEKYKNFVLDDPQTALVLAIQDLTAQLRRLANK